VDDELETIWKVKVMA